MCAAGGAHVLFEGCCCAPPTAFRQLTSTLSWHLKAKRVSSDP